jgi:predicted N-acetyltransferase YhbS
MEIYMNNITVRQAIKTDSRAIGYIHRNCDDPWHDESECDSWVSRRIERGFYIQAGLYNDKIVGHGEWIVSDEPNGKYLYLGMLQVDSDYQYKSVGRAMINDGIVYARTNGCKYISTIPDADTGSEKFYAKCGFHNAGILKSCTISTDGYKDDISTYRIDEVPFTVVAEKTFVFGLSQVSSRHMWEVCNVKPDSDDRLTPAIHTRDGTYMQLSHFKGNESGLVLCWSESCDYKNIFRYALSLGQSSGLKQLEFIFFDKYAYLFEGMPVENYNYEMILEL